jgi:thiamine biosynthesis protein ThiS
VAQVNPDLSSRPAVPTAGLFSRPARRLLHWRTRDHIVGVSTPLSVTVNGETLAIDGPASIASLLGKLGLDIRKVAVERNEAIVPRSAYGETWLEGGDCLEIVHFIGGG